MQIDVTETEYAVLLLMAGYAVASAVKDPELQREFLKVANALGRNSRTGFKPYDIPSDDQIREAQEKHGATHSNVD